MAFGIPDDIAIKVLNEEILDADPTPETFDVSIEYRLQVRREVRAIKEAGGEVDVPAAFPDPDQSNVV